MLRRGHDADRVEELLDMLGGGRRGNRWSCPTPEHADENPSCSTFVRRDGRTGWKCFSCGASGDLVDLLEIAGASRKEALVSAGIIEETPEPPRRRKQTQKRPAQTCKGTTRTVPNQPDTDIPPAWVYDDAPHPADTVDDRTYSRHPEGTGQQQRGIRSVANNSRSANKRDEGKAKQTESRHNVLMGTDLSQVLKKGTATTRPKRTSKRAYRLGSHTAEEILSGKHQETSQTRGSMRSSQPPQREGVIVRPPETEMIDAGKVFVNSLSGHQYVMFEKWVETWPEKIVNEAHIAATTRQWGSQRLPVARIPIYDQMGVPAGWSDRVLHQNAERRWLYSQGLSVRCVGAERLSAPDNEDEYVWPEVWLVEGHSDWLTGLTLSDVIAGGKIPVLGANGTSAMPTLAGLLGQEKLAYRLVVFADHDKASIDAASRAVIAWQEYGDSDLKKDISRSVILSTPTEEGHARGKTDITDLLRAHGREALANRTVEALEALPASAGKNQDWVWCGRKPRCLLRPIAC